MKKSDLVFNILLVPIDFLMLILGAVSAYFIRVHPLIAQWRPVYFSMELPFERYLWISFLVSCFWILIFALSGFYKLDRNRRGIEEFFHIVSVSSMGIMGLIIYIFIQREWFNSRFIILAAWALAIIYVFLGRVIARKIKESLAANYELGIHKVLIIGKDRLTNEITKEINANRGLGYLIVKKLEEPDINEVISAVGNPGIEEIILADPNYPKEKVLELVDFCNEKRLTFRFVPNLFQTLTTNIGIDTFTGVPLIELKRTSLEGWGKVAKRFVDVVGAIIGIIIFLPIMILIAIIIKLESKGPIIYKNERVGPKKIFNVFKFRSMKWDYCVGNDCPNNENAVQLHSELMKSSIRKGPVLKITNDPRRTRFGRFLEKTSLDELPQFFNVLLGNMSLVGPRPHIQSEVNDYQKIHFKVFNVKPGITGIAQISGRSDLDFDDEFKLDAYYIENWSLKVDFFILLKTPFAVLFRRHKS